MGVARSATVAPARGAPESSVIVPVTAFVARAASAKPLVVVAPSEMTIPEKVRVP
jgi:hypothetical protein